MAPSVAKNKMTSVLYDLQLTWQRRQCSLAVADDGGHDVIDILNSRAIQWKT